MMENEMETTVSASLKELFRTKLQPYFSASVLNLVSWQDSSLESGLSRKNMRYMGILSSKPYSIYLRGATESLGFRRIFKGRFRV